MQTEQATVHQLGVQHTQLDNGDVTRDQDAYIATVRPIVTPELTGASVDKEATKLFLIFLLVSVEPWLAYTSLTQAWLQVYIVSLQRVQKPTNLDVRRLNAITRKLQKESKSQCLSR